MILYADTSALVKLFVVEEGSDATRALFRRAFLVGTSVLARAELGAALVRAVRRGLIRERGGAGGPATVRICLANMGPHRRG